VEELSVGQPDHFKPKNTVHSRRDEKEEKPIKLHMEGNI